MTGWRVVLHRAQTVVLVLLLAVIAGREFFPVRSVYFDPVALFVTNTPRGDPVVLTLDRTIYRRFAGRFAVRVRSITTGSVVAECNISGAGAYLPDAVLPDPLYLAWLADQECADWIAHHPGVYTLGVTWWVDVPLLGEIAVTVESNLFEVTG
mgnify:CR=1 FL=1